MILFGGQFARGVLFDPITAIVGGTALSAGTSLLGGIFGSSAASSAAKIQQAAALQAGKGVTDATDAANPGITDAAAKAAADAKAAGLSAGAGATSAAATAGSTAIQAGKDAGAGVTTAAADSNKLLNPYSTAGTTAAGVLDKGIADGGEFNKAPTMADLTIDPGYAFRQQQAVEQLSRGAAAHGAVGGGGFAKDLNDYVQGSASQEYQNAFNRFEQDRQARFGNVSSVAGQGQTAATTEGANTIGAAKYAGDTGIGTTEYAGTGNTNAAEYAGSTDVGTTEFGGTTNSQAAQLVAANKINAAKTAGDYLTQGANAAAAGKVGAANAWTGALTGVGSAVNGGIQNYQFNKLINPYSVTPGVGTGGLPIPPIPGNVYQQGTGG